MTKTQLHQLRYEVDQLYSLMFDQLSGQNRLRFLALLQIIDAHLRAFEDF